MFTKSIRWFMKKVIGLSVAIIVLFTPSVAQAFEPIIPRAKQQSTKTVTIKKLNKQILYLQEQLDQLIIKQGPQGDRGPVGESIVGPQGPQGPQGPAGPVGQGEKGVNGVNGTNGTNGANGKDGIGFVSGTIVLINGNCPEGFTIQGPQNRWTVYANDTNGRPWLTTGSSAQLFLSACQVN
jgi:hypothetical protein